jgi:predicted phosphoribosyltransferase
VVQLPFENRIEAGRLLARLMMARRRVAIIDLQGAAVVLALARGGVPVGFEVADRLRLPLDVIIVRKAGVPWQPELAMGAITSQVRILDDSMIRQLGISDEEVEEIVAREQAETSRREELYRGGQPALDLRGRSAILVDDGLATGSTMLAAVRHVRRLEPAGVMATPDNFFSVGEWYREFEQVGDAEVQRLLAESRRHGR